MESCYNCKQKTDDGLELTATAGTITKTVTICPSCAESLMRDLAPTAQDVELEYEDGTVETITRSKAREAR